MLLAIVEVNVYLVADAFIPTRYSLKNRRRIPNFALCLGQRIAGNESTKYRERRLKWLVQEGWESSLLYIFPPTTQTSERVRSRIAPDATLMTGSWDVKVRRCCTRDTKRSEIDSAIIQKNMSMLAVSETKVKRKGECVF